MHVMSLQLNYFLSIDNSKSLSPMTYQNMYQVQNCALYEWQLERITNIVLTILTLGIYYFFIDLVSYSTLCQRLNFQMQHLTLEQAKWKQKWSTVTSTAKMGMKHILSYLVKKQN